MLRTESDNFFRRDLILTFRNAHDKNSQLICQSYKGSIIYIFVTMLQCYYKIYNLTLTYNIRYTRVILRYSTSLLCYLMLELNMQFSPYNHSLQTEFHVPEISGMNKNNTSLYACCDKLCIQNSCENLRKTREPVSGGYISLLFVFPNR